MFRKKLSDLFAWKIYKSSLGVRRATWVTLGCLSFWRLGYDDGWRDFWDGRRWGSGLDTLGDLLGSNRYNYQSRLEDVLEVLMFSALEVVSVVVAVVAMVQVMRWIWLGFVQDNKIHR